MKQVPYSESFAEIDNPSLFATSINEPAVISTMAAELSGRRKPTKPKKQLGAQKRKRDDVDVEKLEQAVENLVCLI